MFLSNVSKPEQKRPLICHIFLLPDKLPVAFTRRIRNAEKSQQNNLFRLIVVNFIDEYMLMMWQNLTGRYAAVRSVFRQRAFNEFYGCLVQW